MAKRTLLLHPIFFNILSVCIFTASATTQHQIISPKCLSRCGKVDILYPFGVGEGCYRDKGFEIICNNTNSPSSSTPILSVSRSEVRRILIHDDQLISLRVPYTKRCYSHKSGTGLGSVTQTLFDLTHSPFTLSDKENMLIGIGCDVCARINDLKSQKFVTGCVSLCQDDSTVSYGLCTGIGCCETPIPKGLKAFNITVEATGTNIKSSAAAKSDGCSFTTVHNGGRMNRSFALDDVPQAQEVYLDWAIGNGTCTLAKRNMTSYACLDKNSNCVESTNGLGYLCKCPHGFYGNAYLPNGCQAGDCNDCVIESFCLKSTINGLKPSCSCPPGYTGDGRRDGSGCTSSRTRYIFIGVAVGVGVLVLLAVAFLLLFKKLQKRRQIKFKQRFFKKNGGLLLEQQVSSTEGNVEKTKVFVAEELEKATDNFSASRVLGSGGSGTVYKGMLSDGKIVAVKKSKIVDESQIGQFINELVILSHINHRHIVQLFGCCLETEVPLLAYECITNGTLSYHLHDKECKSSLSWDNRLRIATEIASALSYMHSSATTPIFHRDIKSSNILLDENFKAKVSDFGISRSVPCESTHLTTLVQGTFGYLDPEYFHSSQFTDKSDVYSFGVVLVELLTGKKPISCNRPEEEINLAMHFITVVKENCVSEILEKRVRDEGSKEELLVVAKLAKRCLKLVGKKRPTMREVSMELERLRHGEDLQSIPQEYEDTNLQGTKSWSCHSSSFSMSDPESEDINNDTSSRDS